MPTPIRQVYTLTQTAATTSTNSTDINNYDARGLAVYVKTTAIGTGSITITIQGKDQTSGDYFTILVGATITTNTANRYWVFPGATVTGNISANDMLPPTYRILITANNANPASYSVGAWTLA